MYPDENKLTFLAAVEKRREPRDPAQGHVALALTDPPQTEFDGELVDISSSGFRARHSLRELQTGQTVDFRHVQSSGRARVVWNRILEGSIESGFFIIHAEA